jgi:hypothetical protein
MKRNWITIFNWTSMVLLSFVAWRIDFPGVASTCRPTWVVLVGIVLQLFVTLRSVLMRSRSDSFALNSAMLGYWIAVFVLLFSIIFNLSGSLQQKALL